jgi:hypothetical protein
LGLIPKIYKLRIGNIFMRKSLITLATIALLSTGISGCSNENERRTVLEKTYVKHYTAENVFGQLVVPMAKEMARNNDRATSETFHNALEKYYSENAQSGFCYVTSKNGYTGDVFSYPLGEKNLNGNAFRMSRFEVDGKPYRLWFKSE